MNKYRSIVPKFLIPIFLIAILIEGGFSWYFQIKSKEFLIQLLTTRAQLASFALQEVARGKDARFDTKLLVQSLAAERWFHSIIIVNPDTKKVDLSNRGEWVGMSLDSLELSNIIEASTVIDRSFLRHYHEEGSVLHYFVDNIRFRPKESVSYQDKILLIALDSQEPWLRVYSIWGVHYNLLLCSILVLAFFLLYRLKKLIFYPLQEMLEVIRKRGNGQEKIYVQVQSNNELGQVGEALNQMFKHQEEAQKLIKENRKRFQLAVDGTNDGIWDWPDIRKEDQYWSFRFRELLGLTEGIVASHSLLKTMIHPEDLPLFMKKIEASTHSSCFVDLQIRIKNLKEGYRWFVFRAQSSVEQDHYRLSGSIRDVTEMVEAQKKLECTNKDLENLTYIVSHDLMRPVRAIEANASIIREDYGEELEEEVKDRVGAIREKAVWMKEALRGLMEYSSLDGDGEARGRVDMKKLISESLKEASIFVEKPKYIDLQIFPNLPAVCCDFTMVKKVFVNLIQNSAKYNDNDCIRLRFGGYKNPEEDTVVFFLKDNGVGISEKHQDKVFQIFHRINSQKKYGEGTGAGLTFSKKIIENQGGKIWVESELGVGTTFYVSLPALFCKEFEQEKGCARG